MTSSPSTTPKARMADIAKLSQGFVYLVSVTGVTGVRTSVQTRVVDAIALPTAQAIKAIGRASMANRRKQGAAAPQSGDSDRRAKEAAALRENLRKRKAQQRQRLAAGGSDRSAQRPESPSILGSEERDDA